MSPPRPHAVSLALAAVASAGALCVAGAEARPPGQDKKPPSQPTNLVLSNGTQTGMTLGWKASRDNVGVVGYKIFVDGRLVATTP
jgi:hypothetical protein